MVYPMPKKKKNSKNDDLRNEGKILESESNSHVDYRKIFTLKLKKKKKQRNYS